MIEIRSFDNKVLLESKSNSGLTTPFASKLIKLTDIFSLDKLKALYGQEIFLVVKFSVIGGFGRLIVGNYDKKYDALFVSHSFMNFPEDSSDLATKNPESDASLYTGVPCAAPLQIRAMSYPTNVAVEAPVFCRDMEAGVSSSAAVDLDTYEVIKTGGEGAQVFWKQFEGDAFFIYYLKDTAPSRLNLEFNYGLANSRHSTDTAFQFRNDFAPPKYSHWGSGVCKSGFETYIFLCNYSGTFAKTEELDCEFHILNGSWKESKTITVAANSMVCIKASEMGVPTGESGFFSWYLKAEKGTLDTQWISFNTETGEICGDHGF